MKKFMKLLGTSLIGLMALTACGTAPSTGDQGSADKEKEEASQEVESVVVGVTQYVEHPSLDAAYEGFKAALKDNGFVEGENLDLKYQSAQGDQNNTHTIATNLVGDNVDLIFANATPSAIAAQNATNDIPIVFTSVTDAVEAGLVEEMEKTDGNITGVVDLHPESIKKTMEFIDEYFNGAKVGVIYNAGEQNSVVQMKAVEEAAEGTSLQLVTRTVATSAEVQQAANSLVGTADVFFVFTDNTVVSALDSVISVVNDHQIPLVVGEPDSLAKGGFATFGIDYYTIGYRTGEMAAQILKGEKTIADLPVEYPQEMQLFINKTAAEAQGIEWNAKWDEIAEIVE
ncbi:MAG TPA: ABC transporter substrate-binding protein [Bacilli bacterium]|nr:ABC transporter substrate-binding protein [Bacilli bacterium]